MNIDEIKWITDKGKMAESFMEIEAEISHCNKSLNLDNEIISGQFKDDGFYLSDGGELSYNWDIIKWRYK